MGLRDGDLFVSENTKNCYHPGRSGSINLRSNSGPLLAQFGEIHPQLFLNWITKKKIFMGLKYFWVTFLNQIKS